MLGVHDRHGVCGSGAGCTGQRRRGAGPTTQPARPAEAPDPYEAVKAADPLDEDYGGGLFLKGWAYDVGIGAEMDADKAREFYAQAAAAGNFRARERLQALNGGKDPRSDAFRAMEKHIYSMRQLADKGDLNGMGHQVEAYEKGEGGVVPRDPRKVAYWQGRALEVYEKRAADGDAVAMCMAAQHCLLGLGTNVNYEKAADFFEKSYEAGIVESGLRLGDLCATGDGVKKDPKKARELYQACADKGDPIAIWRLAEITENDKTDPKRDAEAAALYKRAFEILSVDERKRGVGMQVGPEKRWLMYRMYAEGKGTEKDLDKALDWAGQATAWRYPGAREVMLELRRKLEADRAAGAAKKAD